MGRMARWSVLAALVLSGPSGWARGREGCLAENDPGRAAAEQDELDRMERWMRDWIEQTCSYAIASSDLSKEELLAVANMVYKQLEP